MRKLFIVGVIFSALPYLMASFVCLTLDFTEWHWLMRLVAAVGTVVVAVWSFGTAIEIQDELRRGTND